VYDIDGTAIAGMTYAANTTATIADNIKNPMTFNKNSSNDGPCTTTYYNMWDARQKEINNITTATVKTIYDPCPAGFCVPTGNLYNFMGKDGSKGRSMTTWDGTNKGATWDNSVVANSITGDALFFPASGYRGSSGGSLGGVGSGCFYWSASPYSSNSGHILDFNSNTWYWVGYGTRADGFPVRAVAEK
jgi:hypothetical protein